MDGLLAPIRDALHPRRYGLSNRERTNRLLLLMQLHANRQADPRAYATSIPRGQRWPPAPRPPRGHLPQRPILTTLTAPLTQNALREATGGDGLRRYPGWRPLEVMTVPKEARRAPGNSPHLAGLGNRGG